MRRTGPLLVVVAADLRAAQAYLAEQHPTLDINSPTVLVIRGVGSGMWRLRGLRRQLGDRVELASAIVPVHPRLVCDLQSIGWEIDK